MALEVAVENNRERTGPKFLLYRTASYGLLLTHLSHQVDHS